MTAAAVAVGGAVGAVLRYALTRWAATARWPWGTALANALGSLLLGVVTASVTGPAQVLLATGVAGALTTYSSFALDAVLIERNGRRRTAALTVVVTLLAGAAAYAAGWWLGGLG